MERDDGILERLSLQASHRDDDLESWGVGGLRFNPSLANPEATCLQTAENSLGLSPMNLRRTPLVVFADDWGRHPSSCQHLVRRMLDHREVYWVNTIGMRPPRLDLATVGRVFEKLGQWSQGSHLRPTHGEPESLTILNPRMWPWFRTGLDRRLNRTLLARQLNRELEPLGEEPVVVTTIPIVADIIGDIPARRWIYYCVDDFGRWPGLDGRALSIMEDELIERADSLIAVSEELRTRIGRNGRPVHSLPHGVDLELWNQPLNGAPDWPWLKHLEPPYVVFWGLVDRRMDVAFLEALSQQMNAGTILLVGPEQDPDPALRQMKRVTFHPALEYDQLPLLAREASVLVMPYADLPVTRMMQPLKLKEYLATGRPVVVRDLPSTRPWGDSLDLAASPEAFARLVQARVETGAPPAQQAARSRLEAEGWTTKTHVFERWLFSEGDET